MHDGKVSVHSDGEGSGSSFSVEIGMQRNPNPSPRGNSRRNSRLGGDNPNPNPDTSTTRTSKETLAIFQSCGNSPNPSPNLSSNFSRALSIFSFPEGVNPNSSPSAVPNMSSSPSSNSNSFHIPGPSHKSNPHPIQNSNFNFNPNSNPKRLSKTRVNFESAHNPHLNTNLTPTLSRNYSTPNFNQNCNPYPNPNPIYNILMVDDSSLNRKLLGKLLRGQCHKVEEAENGLHAIEMVKKKREKTEIGEQTEKEYDVILMDFVMPKMDGPTATKNIREMPYNSPIFGVTGNPNPNSNPNANPNPNPNPDP
jgi:CheY-like chemotaxis protein